MALRGWGRPNSLTARLLGVMILPMAGLALLLGLGGAIAIRSAVAAVNDRILGAASRALAESLSVEDGAIALNLSPAIFGMLEDAERDNVYYSVRQTGKVVTGYADLPDIAPGGLRDTQVVFGKELYKGRMVRIVAEGRRLPGMGKPVIVEIAETLSAREHIEDQLLGGLALLEAALIALTIVLLPWAVRWGMVPLARLKTELDERVGSNLQPLPTGDVPGELRDLVRAFNGMLERLDTTLQSIKRFTSDASHQMRTPLSILRMHVSLLRNGQLSGDDITASVTDIEAASERLQRLLVQLLALARAENTVLARSELEQVSANALAAGAAAEYAGQAVNAGVDLQFVRAPGDPQVTTQSFLAGELVGNLIDNAIRYNRAGGNVVVSVEAPRNAVCILVSDDGPGIPPDQRERVFTRFARLDRDAARSGSGLGLPIAANLARAAGATLTLGTSDRGGLLVTVEFAAPEPGLTAA